MRHKVRSRTLGRQTGHRNAMLRNLATSLIREGRITTTVTRARELSRFTEELISLARRARKAENDHQRLACKRQVFRELTDRLVCQELFEVLAKRFEEKHEENNCGGYTRVIRVGTRKGDGSPMALIEIVE